MNYEKAWKELEDEIRSDIDFFIIGLSDNPSDAEMIVINSFRRVERIMWRIKEKYEEERSEL